ncbi:hypothetical protein GQ43DRAFT_482856 [Delitschia confertaspora ATCC 74209]|uniref:Nucleoporin Pom152 n=1 Tax=Delitschia confertaspora ATCC 74209 TaxID=1513339 RepID=A0A9P4JIP1_9PLEO|nr:hypothetical protein GQ43DRAFT_482856 [Delitschia confertaspora ATCC 74209]
MNGTPRPSGTFPSTPQTNRSSRWADSRNGASPSRRPNVSMPLPEVPRPDDETKTGPLISTDIIDAPTQRFYVFAIYVGLLAYRLYDFYTLAVDDVESFWLFIKWIAIDGTFIFSLPLFQIPWLEWSNFVAVALFAIHAIVDGMLMFRIGVPIQAWLFSLVTVFFDSEMTISEHKANPRAVLNNASLILGKQIINILPEGSAILNPNKEPFCLNSSVQHLEIPIQINQTDPILIELSRIDIGTSQNETIAISGREIKTLMNKAKKARKHADPAAPLLLRYPIKKTGIYLLQKVVDKSKLEVRPRSASLIVATCPQSRVKPTGNNRCRNDLSNIALEVEGTPPLRVKYRTTVNGHPREASEFQSLQPEDFISPLSRHTSQALIHNSRQDVSWAQPRKITVALNETLVSSGVWTYSIEEVQDALGNIVNYVVSEDEDRPKHKPSGLHQSFAVHERPNVILDGCSTQRPLQVAKGNVARLPTKYGSTGKGAISDSKHTIEYLFTAEDDLLPNGDHSPDAQLKQQTLKTIREQPQIQASGLYTIKSISTEFCEGEVLEPASCLLHNPPEPELTLTSEDIVDKCAGNPIGLRVGLDLIGTPPFTIRYIQQKKGGVKSRKIKQIDSLRSTLDLTPPEAGHYTYTFESIKDWVYGERPLHELILEQDVRPSASAHFIDADRPKQICIDDAVKFDVALQGDGPWRLEYELVHSGKRTKHSIEVETEEYTIQTSKLTNGGEYTLALTSITDKMGCKEFLKEEARVNVRHERPKAYFGVIEGRQSVMALEDKAVDLPLRLTGAAPWVLEYENLDTKEIKKLHVRKANDKVGIKSEGTYQLLSVRDSVCPGFVDEKAGQFTVNWIPRPKLSIAESATMVFENGKYIKEPVCEGEEDTFDVLFSGSAPYDVVYEQHLKDKKAGKTVTLGKKELKASSSSATLRTETSQSGMYEYKFVSISDSKYDNGRKFQPIVVQQTVNPRPNAKFAVPGKTYSYCSREEDGEEVIPVTFDGVAPFYLEIEIKHHGTPKPETVSFKNIQTNRYDLRIPHRLLQLGHSNISIRKVRDARNCVRKPEAHSHRVQISVHDAPTATPLETRADFCVGERLSFALGGQAPFTVYYTFNGQDKKATNTHTTFRRLAELPGQFTITGLRDSASECLAGLNISKEIHPIPSVRLSQGRISQVDIHEGGETELEFEFNGTPPFEFTYTRSTNAVKGKKSRVLEIRTETSYEKRMVVRVQEEGTYEVVSIKDRWCSFARPVEGVEGGVVGGKKLLQY